MAKVSAVAKNEKRRELVKKNAARRAKLKAVLKDRSLPFDVRLDAMFKLDKMPKNSSKVRVRNRCSITGRPRGFFRVFGISRIALRDLASWAKIPGVKKSSW